MTTVSTSLPPTDRAASVLGLFKEAPRPLTLAQARQQLASPKPQADELTRLVEELVAQGRLFASSPIGKTPRFWGLDEKQKIRGAVEQLLVDGQIGEAALTSKISKALPGITSPGAIRAVFDQMKAAGQLHIWPGKGNLLGLKAYSAETLLAQEKNRVRQAVAQVLTVNTLPQIPLISRVKRIVRKLSQAGMIEEVLKAMQQEGIVDVWPGKGKLSTLYIVKPFNPAALVRKDTLLDLRTILSKATALGVSLETFMQNLQAVLATPEPTKEAGKQPTGTGSGSTSKNPTAGKSPVELMSLIIKGMRDLDPAAETGASVQLRELRQLMPAEYRGNNSFDPAVLQLAAEGKIILQRCESPAVFNQQQLNEMVRDQAAGTYYVSATNKM